MFSKTAILIAISLASNSNAWFMPLPVVHRQGATRLYSTASEMIKAAKAAEVEHGKGSAEALLAWTEVEEVNAASTPNMSSLDEECDITTDACQEYQTKMAQLENLLKEQQGSFAKMRKLAEEVKEIPKAVKVSSVVPAKESHLTPYAASALQQAIAEAKEATAMYGGTSAEAAVAWDNVEELSASDNSQALQPALSEECLVDMMDACEALEELQNKIVSRMQNVGNY
ncbi:hypothetical protein TrRE_jg4812 [Triparma retinervis]|uniref:Uncharacterized protein n=1 Tax=Triparma retinervis TaxID=2557542 RepID=A0A9W7F7M1_9STRA|nr:hypothetical protein TrRE_jg4812 [Triparma retinervis]